MAAAMDRGLLTAVTGSVLVAALAPPAPSAGYALSDDSDRRLRIRIL